MSARVELLPEMIEAFFRDARERHAIYLRRSAGLQKPWTNDPVMRQYRITNVFRELDKTTVWIRENVRDPLSSHPLVLPAIALCRWFNLIGTLETIFKQPSLFAGEVKVAATAAGAAGARWIPPDPNPRAAGQPEPAAAARLAALLYTDGPHPTPWQEWLATGNTATLEWPLRKQGAPWVTGAYMIRTPIGMDKLEGVLSSFRSFCTQRPKFECNDGSFKSMGWADVAEYCIDARESGNPVTLKRVWEWLKNFYGLGAFMAYEIVTDLRHTKLLDRAPDINTWANPGPGALRGAALMIRPANRVRKGRLEKASVKEAESAMAQLLELSRDPRYWPQPRRGLGATVYDPSYLQEIGDVLKNPPVIEDWPEWELREVEMWLCEMAKITRTRLGFGRPRGNFQ